MCKILKTKIEKTSDLKPGDVLYWYEKGQEAKHPTWPKCNFHRIGVVTNVFQLEDGSYRFGYKRADGFKSSNGDHKIVESALLANKVLDGGTFGCNQHIEGRHPNFSTDYYRLDTVQHKPFVVYDLPNLKGNPAYDLMM